QPTDIDLADERRYVLVVLVSRLGLRDGYLTQARWAKLGNPELRDVAAEFVEPLQAPWAHEAREAPARNAIFAFNALAHNLWIEEAERALEDRAEFVARLQHIDRL